jgi:predicted peroxiredoxin
MGYGTYRCSSTSEKGDTMKMVVWATSGAADPTKASIPLHIVANGCIEVGHDSAVILAGDAAELAIGDNANQIEGVGLPPARELLAKLVEHRVPIYV